MWNVDDVRRAAGLIAPYILKTPLIPLHTLGREGGSFFVKAESFQVTGSFKARGALHALSLLGEEGRRRGVVTASSGSHGKAVAYAASVFNTRAVVVLPENPVEVKMQAIMQYGAETVRTPGGWPAQLARAHQLAEEEGLTFVHSFDTPEIFLGQGTVGLEIFDQIPDVDTLVVPIGGGGLISGLLLVAKALNPKVRVIGVQPEGCAAIYDSWRAGRIVQWETADTIAEGLTCVKPEERTMSIISRYVDDIVTVSDGEIRDAAATLLWDGKLVVEPSGAAATAAYLSGKVPAEGKVVAMATGGNVNPPFLQGVVQEGPLAAGPSARANGGGAAVG